MARIGIFELLFLSLFALAFLVIVWGFVFLGVSSARNARLLRSRGVDPVTVQSELALRRLQTGPGTPPPGPSVPLEARLAELDQLLARGVVSQDERDAARARLLGG